MMAGEWYCVYHETRMSIFLKGSYAIAYPSEDIPWIHSQCKVQGGYHSLFFSLSFLFSARTEIFASLMELPGCSTTTIPLAMAFSSFENMETKKVCVWKNCSGLLGGQWQIFACSASCSPSRTGSIPHNSRRPLHVHCQNCTPAPFFGLHLQERAIYFSRRQWAECITLSKIRRVPPKFIRNDTPNEQKDNLSPMELHQR